MPASKELEPYILISHNLFSFLPTQDSWLGKKYLLLISLHGAALGLLLVDISLLNPSFSLVGTAIECFTCIWCGQGQEMR